ncbi:MAG: CPBP family intramembrane metalloprotease [Dehalococcoidia bacterium]|nr:CPBP family intramembrane metalloprotease [Dehalococcoidia bacterium]
MRNLKSLLVQNLFERKSTNPWLFFVLALGWSWIFWISAAILSHFGSTVYVTALHYIGGVGPLVAAIFLLYRTQTREVQRDYWRKAIDFKRIGIRWYLIIIFIVPLVTALAALVDILFGGQGGQLETDILLSQPLGILSFLVFILLFGPIPEELGWRGYALDRLQAKRSALTSSLILGIIWSLWHLPLFFIDGTYQYNLSFGSMYFWIYMLDMIFKSILFTWIYNNNRYSTLSAILFHFMINLTGELFKLTEAAEVYQFILWIILIVLILMIWSPQKLIRRSTGIT